MAKKSRDDVLRKMLKTKPQPKKANGSAGKPHARKMTIDEAEKKIRKAMGRKD